MLGFVCRKLHNEERADRGSSQLGRYLNHGEETEHAGRFLEALLRAVQCILRSLSYQSMTTIELIVQANTYQTLVRADV